MLPTLIDAKIRDVHEMNDFFGDWDIRATQLCPGQHEITSRQLTWPDLVVERYRSTFLKQVEYRAPPGITLFILFRQGTSPGHWCGHEIKNDVLLINHPDQDHFAIQSPDHDAITIWLSDELVERWHLQTERASSTRARLKHAILPLRDGPSANGFRNWLFGQFKSRFSLNRLTHDSESAEVFRHHLLTGLGNLCERGIETRGGNGRRHCFSRRYSVVRHACQMVHERIRENINTRELASELNVNVRMLERGFAEVIGVGPYRYAKLCKLNAIRKELLEQPFSRTTVTQVAHGYGISQLGHFSHCYRRMFGELPSDTLRQGTRSFGTTR